MLKSLSTIISGLLVAAVLMQPSPAFAAEHENENAEPKKEAHDAMATGTKGVSTGTVVSNQKGKLILKTKEGNLLFMPHWRGGDTKYTSCQSCQTTGFVRSRNRCLFSRNQISPIEW